MANVDELYNAYRKKDQEWLDATEEEMNIQDSLSFYQNEMNNWNKEIKAIKTNLKKAKENNDQEKIKMWSENLELIETKKTKTLEKMKPKQQAYDKIKGKADALFKEKQLAFEKWADAKNEYDRQPMIKESKTTKVLTLSEYTKQKRLLKESGLARLYKHWQEHESGTISAFRGERTTSENKELSKKLKAILLSKGYSVTPIKCVFIENYNTPDTVEVKEESYFVVDIKDEGNLEKDLQELGKQFEQDSVTFSEKGGNYFLIGTKKGGYPGLGKKEKLGSAMFGKDGEFMSKINGRPFVFESIPLDNAEIDKVLTDFNIFSIRSIKNLANS